MRLALPLATLALLALAGSAAASDYMLPPLLEQRPEPYSAADPTPTPREPQGGAITPVSATAMGAAVLGAAIVVGLTFAVLGRANRRRA